MYKKYIQIADNMMLQPSLSEWCLANIMQGFNSLNDFGGKAYIREHEGVFLQLPSGNMVVACNANVFEEKESANTGISLYSRNPVMDGKEFAFLVEQFTRVADAGDSVSMRALVLYDKPKQVYEDSAMKVDDVSVIMGVCGLTDISIDKKLSEADFVKGGFSPFASINQRLKEMAKDVSVLPNRIMEASESVNQPSAMQM